MNILCYISSKNKQITERYALMNHEHTLGLFGEVNWVSFLVLVKRK